MTKLRIDQTIMFQAWVHVTSVSAKMSADVAPQAHCGWTFSCSPLAPDDDEATVLNSGNYLKLEDSQVKQLQEGSSLFRYWVRIVPK